MNKKITLSIAIALSICSVAISSCTKEKGGDAPKPDLEIKTVNDLDGTAGTVYYNLRNNAIVTGADTLSGNWDLKFDRTKIFVNSGSSGVGTAEAQVLTSTFEDVINAPETGYKPDTDAENAISGWYRYTGSTAPEHAILTVPGKIIVMKTGEGKYAKLEMLSYYLGNPNTSSSEFADISTRPPSSYYTFRYAVQLDGSTSLK